MLNPSLTFANFIVTRGTRRAWTAAQSVASDPARTNLLLYLYGVSETGKTHLLHAIANAIQQADPDRRVRILTAEEFERDRLAAIKAETSRVFRQGLCTGEMLLFDNLSFLRGKPSAQKELANVIGCYHAAGGSVAIAGEARMFKLEQMETSLAGLLAQGDRISMRRPEPASRMAILRIKAEQLGITLPEEAAMEIVSRTAGASVETLRGKLLRITAYAALFGVPVDLKLTRSVLKENQN